MTSNYRRGHMINSLSNQGGNSPDMEGFSGATSTSHQIKKLVNTGSKSAENEVIIV